MGRRQWILATASLPHRQVGRGTRRLEALLYDGGEIMTRGTSTAWIAAALLVTGATVVPAQAQTSGRVTAGQSKVCCFNNFRFAGGCEVTLEEGESCMQVLAYLNDLNSAGQRYCRSTVIRGGWTLETCDGASGGLRTTPGTVRAEEPTTTAARPVRPVSPTATGPAPAGRATFITPVSPSTRVRASEPELIDL